MSPLLTIAIPTYNRCALLKKTLSVFEEYLSQTDFFLEIVVVDDASTDSTLNDLSTATFCNFNFRYVRNKKNIGLEHNLINACRHASGDYLWLFGDDDYLVSKASFDDLLREMHFGTASLYVLNRIRTDINHSKILSKDWMEISGTPDRPYTGLREFFRDWGFLSVVGFISVNVFKREAFLESFDDRYFGTMYPQLGMLASAFADCSVILKTTPTVCQRTLTADEKAEAFKTKEKEGLFMSDVRKRNAVYFGLPFIRMFNMLAARGALPYREINRLTEFTVCNGRLVDFVASNVCTYLELGETLTSNQAQELGHFLKRVPRTKPVEELFCRLGGTV